MNQKKTEVSASTGTEFPALKKMGIKTPSEITHYSLRQEGNEDVLRVHYKRANNSFLPASRKYRFGRSSKTIITDSGKPGYAEDTEISGFLQRAIAELDEIVVSKKDHDALKSSLIDELDHLEKYVNSRIRALRSQVEQL